MNDGIVKGAAFDATIRCQGNFADHRQAIDVGIE